MDILKSRIGWIWGVSRAYREGNGCAWRGQRVGRVVKLQLWNRNFFEYYVFKMQELGHPLTLAKLHLKVVLQYKLRIHLEVLQVPLAKVDLEDLEVEIQNLFQGYLKD